ncbi:ECF RNA polymerase sigma factor SigW [bacterium HR15]|nr:ECF RNA polymerase sigma factor SigW [bacterium HR15]
MDTPSWAEATLIARAQAQDDTAFDQIVRLYADRIYNYVRRMVGNPQDAEDITQEVFIRAYQGLSQFDGRASFSTWLFRIATNLCIDHKRRQSRRVQTVPYHHDDTDEEEGDWEFPDTSQPSALEQLLTKELHEVVERAIEALSPKLKTVLLLYDVEGLSYEQIADALGIPMGTVKSRLFAAREQIRKQVEVYLRGGTE